MDVLGLDAANGSVLNMPPPNGQTTTSPFIQSQGHDPIRDGVHGCTFESPSHFSPVGEATSPLQLHRGASFHNGPFPMEIGGGNGTGTASGITGAGGMFNNNSQCNTPASTPGSAGTHFNQNPFTFQQQLGQTVPTFGFGTASCSFQNSRTAYRSV